MKRTLFALWSLVLWVVVRETAANESVGIRAAVDRHRAALNESIVLNVTVFGIRVDRPELPDLKGIVAYPSGQSHNITMVNGKLSSSATFTFILQPKRVGIHSIPAIEITHDGKTYRTEPIEIEVTQVKDLKTKEPDAPRSGSAAEPTQTPVVYVEAFLDKKKAFVGEQVTYTFKFYRRVNLLDQPSYSPPKFTNFWVEDLPPEKLYYEMVNGTRYVVSEINMGLFPATTGHLTIEPALLRCRVRDAGSRRDSFSVFDEDPFQFFSRDPFDSFRGRDVQLRTEPIVLEVSGLPAEGRPENFGGTVGRYTIRAEVDRRKTAANQPVSFAVVIEGQGNIQSIGEPPLEPGPDFKVYDSGQSSEIKKEGGVVAGKREFRKLMIPQRSGEMTIPAVEFSYFDPLTREYRAVSTEPVLLTVLEGSTDPEQPAPSGMLKTLETIKRDIQYIKTDFHRFRNITDDPSQSLLAASLIFPAVFFMVSAGFAFRRSVRDRYPERFVPELRCRSALSKLKALNREGQTLDEEAFLSGLSFVLAEFLSGKLGTAVRAYQVKELDDMLRKRRVDPKLVERLHALLDQIQSARFARTGLEQAAREKLVNDVNRILREMEKAL